MRRDTSTCQISYLANFSCNLACILHNIHHFMFIFQINNPDMRVKIIKDFVLDKFPATPLLHYALEVEKITTSKKPNLILNVDGVIAVAFCDLLRHSGAFTRYSFDFDGLFFGILKFISQFIIY